MTRMFFLFLITIFTVSCAGTSDTNIKKAQYHYQLGISYLNDNNIQPAFAELQKSLELNPRDKETHNALGVIYLTKLEDFKKAREHFEKALSIDQEYSEAATNLGNTYASMKQYDAAIESYKNALSNPQYRNAAMALHNLGMVYYRLGRYDDALNAFRDALKRYADFHAPYYGLALTYNAKKQFGDAATALRKAIDLDPLYRGDADKAIEDLMHNKAVATGEEAEDLADFLEIIKY